MKTGQQILLTASLFAISACASALASLAPPQNLRQAVEVKSDPFRKVVTLNGIEGSFPEWFSNRYFIRTLITASGTTGHQLYVSDTYDGDWRYFRQAYGEDATQLEFTDIGHDIGSCRGSGDCTLTEVFGATIPDSILRTRTASGYAVKFYAKSGDTLVIRLTPEQIARQISAVDSVKAAAPH